MWLLSRSSAEAEGGGGGGGGGGGEDMGTLNDDPRRARIDFRHLARRFWNQTCHDVVGNGLTVSGIFKKGARL